MFTLYCKDKELLQFEGNLDTGTIERVVSITPNNLQLMPYPLLECNDLEEFGNELIGWIGSRVMPYNREYFQRILKSVGREDNNQLALLMVNHGTSLNDSYWIKEDTEELTFADVSLYSNHLKEDFFDICFYGNTSSLLGRFTTPETTNHGMLAKCWRDHQGEKILYKKGTSGFRNAGYEPISEHVASELATILNFDHVDYGLLRWEGELCNTCHCFCTEDISFVKAYEFFHNKKVNKLKPLQSMTDEIKKLDPKIYQKFTDMLIFDYLIENRDRHLGNWGFLRDNTTGKIIDFAPLYDHGLSLFAMFLDDDFPVDYSTYTERNPSFNATNRLVFNQLKDSNYKDLGFKLLNEIDRVAAIVDKSYRFIEKDKGIETPAKISGIVELIEKRAKEIIRG